MLSSVSNADNRTKYLHFKIKYNWKQRTQKFQKHIQENPTKIPIIIQPSMNSKLPAFKNPRFSVPKDKDIVYLKINIKQKLSKMEQQQFNQRQGIFFYVGRQMVPSNNQTLQSFYNKNKDLDGFLYITYSEMEVF